MILGNLKRARENRGMTQEEVHDLTYVGRVHLSNLENGKATTTPKTAKRLAAVLNYEIWQLVSDDPKALEYKRKAPSRKKKAETPA